MRLHYRVQHAAGRDAALARLLEHLTPAVEVVTDHESGKPNPMRGFLSCLQDPPPTATHLVVLQDDILPCKNFHAKVEQAVSERPDVLISLFVGGLPNRTRKAFYEALKANQSWSQVYFRDIHHVVGTIWPVGLAAIFVEWFKTAKVPGPKPPRSDDAVVGFFCRTKRIETWATVPCLVEHPDDFPSTLRAASRFGDRARRAIAFADDIE